MVVEVGAAGVPADENVNFEQQRELKKSKLTNENANLNIHTFGAMARLTTPFHSATNRPIFLHLD
jgi:uncharacterized protein YegL